MILKINVNILGQVGMCHKLKVARARRKFLKAVRDVNEGEIPHDLPLSGRTGEVRGQSSRR